MAKNTIKMVKCRYPKCKFLHESTELKKDDAVKGGKGSSYYHPDCYHTMQTVMEIRDLFVREIDPLLTGKQIGMLVSTINNIVLTKHVDVDYLEFALKYFIKYKPGALKHPGGLHYIIQSSEVSAAWKKLKEQKIKNEMKEQRALADVYDESGLNTEPDFEYKPLKTKSFEDILN